jgi:hypothetical protein
MRKVDGLKEAWRVGDREIEKQPASVVVILTLNSVTSGSTRDEDTAEKIRNYEASSSRNSKNDEESEDEEDEVR